MLAKKANLNRCGFQCKAEVRQFCVVTEWRQMAITVYKQGPFVCWVSLPLISTYRVYFKIRAYVFFRGGEAKMCTQKMLQSSWLHCCREVRDGCRVLLAVWLTGEHDGNATTQLRLNLIKPQIHHDLSYTLQKQMVRNDYCCGFRVTDELTDTHIEMMSLITMQLLTNFMHIAFIWGHLLHSGFYKHLPVTASSFKERTQAIQKLLCGLWIAHKELCTPWSRTC